MEEVKKPVTLQKPGPKNPPPAAPKEKKPNTKKAPSARKPQKKETGGFGRVLKVQLPLMHGDDVKALQKALIEKKYFCGPNGADGRYGKDTAYAARCFQSRSGLVVDGKAGMHTIKALGGVWKPAK